MAVYRRGAVTIRISEKDMERAMKQIATRSAGGAAYFLAGLAQKFIQQRNLINKGTLLSSISVAKAGRGGKIGVYYRVFTDVSSSPYAGMQHAGSGPIVPKSADVLVLQYRRNNYRKASAGRSLVWTAQRTRGYQAQPFLAAPAKALREHDFAYAVQKNSITGASISKGGRGAAALSDKVRRDIEKALREGT